LDVLPLLLSCPDPAAQDLITLIGKHGSAKEIIIAVQEGVGQLQISDDDETNTITPTRQLQTLVMLCSSGKLNANRKVEW
jgi:hypothetical protein